MKRGLIAAACAVIFFAAGVRAEIRSAVIHVDGLSCPFCAYGLEKYLKKMPGVVGWKLDIKNGQVSVDFDTAARPRIETLTGIVADAGFTPTEIDLVVEGRLRETKDGLVLEDSGVLLLVSPPEGKTDDERDALLESWRSLLTALRVRVEGRVDAQSKGDATRRVVVSEISRVY